MIDLAARLGVSCRIAEPPDEPLEDRAARAKTSLEAEARDFRYSALLETAAREGCERILTAHTRDDQSETLLLRILSGSGTAGLRGIPEDRPPFLRPFLSLPKEDLLRYLREQDQPWIEDSTNAGMDYLRNRVRHGLIPTVKSLFPGYTRALSVLSEKSRLDEDYLSGRAQVELPACRSEGQSSFDARSFRAAHPALRIRALTTEASRLVGSGRRVPYALIRTAALADPSVSDHSEPRILARGMGLQVSEAEGRILVTTESSLDGSGRKAGLESEYPEDVTFVSGYAFLFERPGVLRIDTGGSCTVYFRPGATGPAEGTFDFPLTIRSRFPGDCVAIRGGRKYVDDILTEWKMPRGWRAFVPVLEDRRGIVGVLGSPAGFRDRFRQGPNLISASIPRLTVELEGIGPFRSIERSAKAP